MPKRAGVAENAAAARPISCKIPEYLQERGKNDAWKGCRETRHPIQETGMHRKGERNVHPLERNATQGETLCR